MNPIILATADKTVAFYPNSNGTVWVTYKGGPWETRRLTLAAARKVYAALLAAGFYVW